MSFPGLIDGFETQHNLEEYPGRGRLELRADTSLRAQNPQSLLSDLGISIPEVAGFEFAGQAWLNFDAVGIENLVGKIGNSNIDARGLA